MTKAEEVELDDNTKSLVKGFCGYYKGIFTVAFNSFPKALREYESIDLLPSSITLT